MGHLLMADTTVSGINGYGLNYMIGSSKEMKNGTHVIIRVKKGTPVG